MCLEAVKKTRYGSGIKIKLAQCVNAPLVIVGKPIDDYRKTDSLFQSRFLAMMGRLDLLTELGWFRNRFVCPIMLRSSNVGIIIPIMEDFGTSFDEYVTPVNKSGVMMFVLQKSSEGDYKCR